MTDAANELDTGQAPQSKPTVTATWNGPTSAEVEVRIEGCTPAQLWAAAKLIEHYADDLYRGAQIEAVSEQMQQQMDAERIARELTAGVAPGKIVPVRVGVKRSDA